MRTTLLAILLTAVVACGDHSGGGDVSDHGAAQSTQSARNTQAVPENSTAMNPVTEPSKDIPGKTAPVAAPDTQTVQLTEYAIQMPQTLKAGPSTLNVVNAGKEMHSFEIEGNGVHAALPSPLSRGESRQLSVDLKPGTYTAYCPVDGHKGHGMTATLTVQ